MKRAVLLIGLLAAAISLSGCITDNYNGQANQTGKDYCTVDSDCVLKRVGCDKDCPCPCITYGCVNKNWDMNADCSFPEGAACPPAPPWLTACKCINSKCAGCRDVFPVAEGTMQCDVDGERITYPK